MEQFHHHLCPLESLRGKTEFPVIKIIPLCLAECCHKTQTKTTTEKAANVNEK